MSSEEFMTDLEIRENIEEAKLRMLGTLARMDLSLIDKYASDAHELSRELASLVCLKFTEIERRLKKLEQPDLKAKLEEK